jgi:flavin reductase
MPATETDTEAFRAVMGCFATGVALLTCGSGKETAALTVNSLTSVSLDPLLVLVCVKTDGQMRGWLSRAGSFAVNILAEDQQEISRQFARSERPTGEQAVRQLPAVRGVTGNLVLTSAPAVLECLVHAEYDAGDHVMFLGQVVALRGGTADHRPLLYHRGRYAGLTT